MTVTRSVSTGAAVLLLLVVNGFADELVVPEPSSVRHASLEADSDSKAPCEDEAYDAGSDARADFLGPSCSSSCGCGSCGGRCRGFRLFGPLCCCEQSPRRLFPCAGSSLGIDVYGWVNAGFTVNDDDPPSNFNGVLLFNDRQNELQMNQFYLVAERPVETGPCAGFNIGGRVDLLYGTDARFVEVPDLDAEWNNEEFYGLAMPQLYLDVAYNNLKARMGHFYTIAGYERVAAPQNFFYSHSFATTYGVPLTHSGVLASYDLGPWTIYSGFDRGDDRMAILARDEYGFLGGIGWDNRCGTSVAATVMTSKEHANPFIPGFIDDRTVFTLVAQKEIGCRWTSVFQYLYGVQETGSPFDGSDADWIGISQYVFYQLNCKWTLGVRVEWFDDHDGLKVGGIGRRISGSPIVPFGFRGDFYEVTLGANWKPTPNLTLRPEVRFDWYHGISGFGPRPYDDGLDDEQVTFAMDFIYCF